MRPYAVLFREQATRQLDDARQWLLVNRGAFRARDLDDELAAALRLLEACPDMYAIAPGSTHVRRLRLDRAGYHVYYRVFPGQAQIVVIRIRHERRKPLG